jgi:hypothetical protein
MNYAFLLSTAKRFSCTFSPTGHPTTGITTLTPSSTDIDESVFHHVCMERNASDKLRLYMDGAMIASATGVSGGTNISGDALRIGDRGDGGLAWNGWLDELRLTKGVARYDTDTSFTVPTAKFPRS